MPTPDFEIVNANGKKGVFEHDPDYRGQLSPFRHEIKRGQTATGAQGNIFTIHDYKWYPYGLAEYFNDDFYHNANISVQDAGIFDGVSISDISSPEAIAGVANKSLSYAKNQFAGVIDSIGGLFDKGPDANADDATVNPLVTFLDTVPTVRLYEFQPNNSISELGNLFGDMFKFFDNLFSGESEKNYTLIGMKKLFSEEGMSELIRKVTGMSPEDLQGTKGQVISIPEFFYRNLIGGFYTAQYDLPFFQQTGYLNGMGDQGWESRSLKQRLFPAGLSGILDKFSDVASSFDIASKPKWTMDGSGPAMEEVTFEFMLFNHTAEDVIKNIKLIHSLCGGNMWIQKSFKQLSPSLYDIEVPSRYRYYFCKAMIKAEYSGKQRLAPQGLIQQFSADRESLDIQINPNAFKYVPDAYKMTITFQPLIPNNFNTYLNYLSNDTNRISVGDNRESVGFKFASTTKELADQYAKEAEEADRRNINQSLAEQ